MFLGQIRSCYGHHCDIRDLMCGLLGCRSCFYSLIHLWVGIAVQALPPHRRNAGSSGSPSEGQLAHSSDSEQWLPVGHSFSLQEFGSRRVGREPRCVCAKSHGLRARKHQGCAQTDQLILFIFGWMTKEFSHARHRLGQRGSNKMTSTPKSKTVRCADKQWAAGFPQPTTAHNLKRAPSAVGREHRDWYSQGSGFEPDLSHKAHYMQFACPWQFEMKLRFFCLTSKSSSTSCKKKSTPRSHQRQRSAAAGETSARPVRHQ